MSVTFFAGGLEVSDGAAARADDFCVAIMLSKYRDAHNGDDPPGWPNPAGHKSLIEYSIQSLFAKRVLRWERELAIQGLDDPLPWESMG